MGLAINEMGWSYIRDGHHHRYIQDFPSLEETMREASIMTLSLLKADYKEWRVTVYHEGKELYHTTNLPTL